jgi:hypothetical protein
VRSREQRIATVTTNIRQYHTKDLQTDGILVLVQDEGDTSTNTNIPSVCGSVV